MSDFKQFGNPIGKGIAYTLELLTPYERKLGVIPAVLNYQYRNKVMGLNEIEFDIPAYFIVDQKDIAHPFYHIVDNGMLIQVHIAGQKEPLQYIVDTVNESTDKSTEAQKHIHAFSKEYFLSRKKFLGMELAGRILYYTPDLPEKYRVDGDGLPRGLLNDIFEKYGIEVTHIDESLKRKAREISIGSTNIYQFLTHLEEIFGCIFKFNGDATKVEIYDSANFGRKTGITISERNVINTFSEDTRFEDMVTRLYIYGADEVSIASVNPTGLPYIDNFSYFFKENYLPKYLIDLYNEFAALPKQDVELGNLVKQRNDLLNKITEAEFYLEVVRDELRQALHWAEALDLRAKNDTDYIGSDPKYTDSSAWNALTSGAEVRAFINAVKANTTLTDRSFTAKNTTFVSLLELSRSADEELRKLFENDLDTLQARGGEAGWLAEINRLKQSYDIVNKNIKSLQTNNDFNQYMAERLTAEQFAEGKKALDAITIEGEYINSDLDSSMLNELLEEGRKELDKLCFPKIQFTVDALDFSQLFDTQDLWNYLLLGDIIYVKTDTGFNYPVHFIGIEHSPDTASLNLQFSSSAALADSAAFLGDLIANATRANGILSLNKDTWNKAAEQASAINQQLKAGFDLAQQQLAGASKQVPILDERGFWLYALDSNENPKPEQIRAINNVIALTKDGWETIEVAITPEGINANAIVVGTMSADRVRLGKFESADKSTYWNLETNEIKIGDNFYFSPETGLKLDFQTPTKHKNLISTAEFFTEYSISMPEGTPHRSEVNALTGELSLIVPKESGTYNFYLAVDSATLTQDFTLLSDNLQAIGGTMPHVTFALANSNHDLYSDPVTVSSGQGIYTIKPTVTDTDLPLSLLQISLTKDSTATETGIKILPETLALVKDNVADLTWENTVISGVSSSTVITNERFGVAIKNAVDDKLASLDITEDGIKTRVEGATKDFLTGNVEQFKGESSYLWIRYSPATLAEVESLASTGKNPPYTKTPQANSNLVGILTLSSPDNGIEFPTESSSKLQGELVLNFQWSKFTGQDGKDGYTPVKGIDYVDGKDGLPGPAGTNSYTHIAYANSADGSIGFSNTNSVNKTHIGIYVDNVLADSADYKKYKWTQIKGLDGKDGVAGKDGVGVKTTTITYGLSTSESTMPTSFTAQVPALQKGQYLWTKTVWSYSDNTTETGYSKTYIAKDGNNGADGIAGKDGVGIKTTIIQYAQSSSGTVTPTSGWTTTIPSVAQGNYLWTKTTWNYTDNTSETGYSVAHVGKDGAKGTPGIPGADGKTPYLHIAYATDENGTNFSTTVSQNQTYIGTYTDFTEADSADYRKYSWTKIKGEPGATGASGTNGVNYANGKMLYTDPTFIEGMNSVAKYTNNQTNSPNLILTLTTDSLSPFKTSGSRVIKINTTSVQSPGYGGFVQQTSSRPNAVFVHRFIARVPVGWKVGQHQNNTGNERYIEWLTPQEGTGRYEEYAYKHVCGQGGSFSTLGYVYLEKTSSSTAEPTSSAPLTWYLAYATMYDMTDLGSDYDLATMPIVYSRYAPKETNKLWYDLGVKELKQYTNGDWTKIEDSSILERLYELENATSQIDSWISETNDAIAATVKNATELKTKIEEYETSLKVTDGKIKETFEAVTISKETNEIVQRLSASIVSATDADGHTYTEWGSMDGVETVRVGADGITMRSGGVPFMTMKDGIIHANSLFVTNTIGFGNHTAIKYGTEFTVFPWTGGK